MPSVWKAPPEKIEAQLSWLVDVLGCEASAPTRAGLVALGDVTLVDDLTAAARAHADAWLLRDALDAELAGLRIEGDERAVAAYAWVKELRVRLRYAEAMGADDVAALRQRLGLDRLRSRVRSMLDGLRVLLPELRQARLPAGALAVAPAFLAEGDAHLASLDAHEEARHDVERALADARRVLRAATRGAEVVVRRLLGGVDVLRAARELPCTGIDLRVLLAWRASLDD